MLEVTAWTDGACSGNPGPGGWGVLMQARRDGELVRQRELKGGAAQTTNNRMEMTAAIEALNALKTPSRIRIVTDSTYLRDGITKWLHGWKRKGWKTAAKKPVKNAELWQELEAAAARHQVEWDWIKGHAGHEENERADELAREGMAPYKKAGRGAS